MDYQNFEVSSIGHRSINFAHPLKSNGSPRGLNVYPQQNPLKLTNTRVYATSISVYKNIMVHSNEMLM